MSRPKPAKKHSVWDWPRNTGPANAARRGVRLHDPGPEWASTRKALRVSFRRVIPELVSRQQLAYSLGVDPKTIARWLSGKHLPTAANARKCRAWLNRVRPQS